MTLKLNGTNSVAAPAYAGDDADTGLQCGTNELKLVTGGTARATVDSSGNLGIGTVPSGLLTSGYNLRLNGGSQTFIAFNNSTHTTQATGGFSIGHSANAAYITQRENQPIIFSTNDAERMRILSSGGITFNGDTATANALDDYEEGEWTPTVHGYSGTLTVNSADYVKVGQLVHINMYISFSDTADSSQVDIRGLPFTGSGENNHYSLITAHTNGNLPNFALRAQGTTTRMIGVYLNNSDGDQKPTYTNVRNKFIICGGTYRATP